MSELRLMNMGKIKRKKKNNMFEYNLTNAANKVVSVERQLDQQEQYLRENCVLLHEIPKTIKKILTI